MIGFKAFPGFSHLCPRQRTIFPSFHLIHPFLSLNMCKLLDIFHLFYLLFLLMVYKIRQLLLNLSFVCLLFPFFHVCRLQGMGFEKGWGDTAEHVLEMMHLLLDILQAPDPSTLEKFLGRLPMVFNVVILSPHGYFGQANVLGLPDTGGQVFIILLHVTRHILCLKHGYLFS